MTKLKKLLEQKMQELFEMGYKISVEKLNTFGKTDTDSKIIYINSSLTPAAKQFIFMHEFFHATDASNSNNPQNNQHFFNEEIEVQDEKAVKALMDVEFEFTKLEEDYSVFKKIETIIDNLK